MLWTNLRWTMLYFRSSIGLSNAISILVGGAFVHGGLWTRPRGTESEWKADTYSLIHLSVRFLT